MAENQDDRSKDDLTEEASPFRVEEYRSRGQVSQSRELTSIIALLAAGVTCYAMSPSMGGQMAEFMKEVFRTDLMARLNLGDSKMLGMFSIKSLKLIVSLAFPICAAGFVFAVVSSFVQIGAIFSLDPLTPDFSKINPLGGLKRMLSLRQVTEGFRLVLKMTVVLAIAYGLVKTEVLQSPAHMGNEPMVIFAAYAHSAKAIFLSLVLVLSVFAGIDFVMQRREFNKNLRMTKQEAKQEFKEREGDPQIKARIRSVQREMARRRMMQAVKKADVIVTNPTHIAVAIVYAKDSMAAPKVVAKGTDFLAQRIKKIAADAGVPLVENVPLARTLYKSVKVGQYVPRVLYQAVAEVLAYVYRLRRQDF